MNHSPCKITVYTIAYEKASECLMVVRELQRQTVREQIEMIVVAPNRDGIDESEFAVFGAWQWLVLPEIEICGKAMAEAVKVARAPLVTYAEEHSYFDERWAERLLAAHEKGYDAVGFAMENANPEVLTSWAQLYGQFGPVVAPVESGESTFLAGHHVSFRRDLLLGYGDLLEAMMEDESALFLDLRTRGVKMFIAGDAVSRHVNVSDLWSYIRIDYLGQRSFAHSRVQVGKWNLGKRVLYAGAAPLIPWVRLRRILRDVRRTGRQKQLMPQMLAPLSLALTAGAWGEMLGYLFGARKCAVQRAPVELQRENYLSDSDNWTKSRARDIAS